MVRLLVVLQQLWAQRALLAPAECSEVQAHA